LLTIIKPTTIVKQNIKIILTCQIDGSNIYRGRVYGMHYIDAEATPTADQIFITEALIDSSDLELCVVPGYVAQSPYGTLTAPSARPAAYHVDGTVHNALLPTPYSLSGNIDLSSSNNMLFIQNGNIVSDYNVLDAITGEGVINHGIITSSTGARYFIESSYTVLASV
jgi:hypothetical protein